MKLGKKLMVVAMAVATFGMVGCALNQDGEGAIRGKKVDFDNSYVFVKGGGIIEHAENAEDTSGKLKATENKNYFYRAVKQLATKHYDSTCIMTITPNSSTEPDGVMGYWISGKENTEWNNESCDDMDCIMVGVRYCPDCKMLESYISKLSKVAFKDNNFSANKNFYDISNVEIGEEGCVAEEKEILSGKESGYLKCGNDSPYAKINGNFVVDPNAEKKTYKIAITATARDDGSYDFDFYEVGEDGKKTGEPKIKTVNVSKELTGLEKKTQTNLGWYANIYPGQHLTGEWNFVDTNGNVIPVE